MRLVAMSLVRIPPDTPGRDHEQADEMQALIAVYAVTRPEVPMNMSVPSHHRREGGSYAKHVQTRMHDPRPEDGHQHPQQRATE